MSWFYQNHGQWWGSFPNLGHSTACYQNHAYDQDPFRTFVIELVSTRTLAKEQVPFRNFALYLVYFQNHCHLTFAAGFFTIEIKLL